MSKESEELRSQLCQMEKELQYLSTELEAQKEANVRSPSNTMKNLVERLKAQLALKEKQLKVTEWMHFVLIFSPEKCYVFSFKRVLCLTAFGSFATQHVFKRKAPAVSWCLIFLFGVQALSKAMLEFRAQMTSQAEQQIIANAAQKEEALNVQQIVDKQTKELKVWVLTGSTHTEVQRCSDLYLLAYRRGNTG